MLAGDRGIGQAHVVVGAPADRDPLLVERHVHRRAVREKEHELAHGAYPFFFASQRCAQPLAGRNSGGTRTRTTEMLSRPPFWLARSTRSAAATARSARFFIDDRVDDFAVHHVRQPVGAQQVDVVRFDPVFGDVGRHDRLDAEGARHQVLVERIARLLGREHATVDLFLQQRVVAGQLIEFLAAQPIAARVADVPDRHAVTAEYGGDDRRAHPGAFGPRLRGFVDSLVRGGDLLLEQERAVGQAALDVDLGQFAAGAQLRHHPVGHDVDRDAARDFARVVAAHAVGEHRDTRLAVDEHGILVVRAHHPGVRQAGDIESHGFTHGLGLGDRAVASTLEV